MLPPDCAWFPDGDGGYVLGIHLDFKAGPGERFGELAPLAQKFDTTEPGEAALLQNPVLALEQRKRVFDHVVEHFEGAAVLAARRTLADALM